MIKAENDNVEISGDMSLLHSEFCDIIDAMRKIGFRKEDLEYGVRLGFMSEEECLKEAREMAARNTVDLITNMILLKALEDDLK